MALTDRPTNTYKVFPSEQFKFEDVGDTLEGHLVESANMVDKETKKPYKRYTFRTRGKDYVFTNGNHQIDVGLSGTPIGVYTLLRLEGIQKIQTKNGQTGKMKQMRVQTDTDDVIDVSSLESEKVELDLLKRKRSASSVD